jgi:outer membrane lipoprotein-sorting protein
MMRQGVFFHMMNVRGIAASLLFSGIVLCGSSRAIAQSKPGHLDEVLRQMDAASEKFKSAQADFRWDLYERVVKETTTQTGIIYFQRDGALTEMGAKVLPPSAKVLEYRRGQLSLFDPGANHLIVMSAGAKQAEYESFLTLGFGGSGRDMAKAWTISDLGTEPMSDGDKMVSTEKLDLVAKDPSVRGMFTHIVIWIDPTRAISLKQQFFMPSEDVRTSVYTHIRYNEKVDTKPFAIKTDKNTSIDDRR